MSKKNGGANIISFIHGLWVLWGLLNLPLVIIYPSHALITLIYVGLTVVLWVIFGGCLLWQVEQKMRAKKGNTKAFEGQSFIQHYINKIFGTNFSNKTVEIFLYIVLLGQLGVALKIALL